MILVLILVFVATFMTGPAGKEYLDKRKKLKEKPLAKVLPFPYPPGHPKKV